MEREYWDCTRIRHNSAVDIVTMTLEKQVIGIVNYL